MTVNQSIQDIQAILLGSPSASIGKFGTLDTIEINSPKCSASVCLYGAHVIRFKPAKDGIERLWTSANSYQDGSRAIRGGIPICWPWFAGKLPASVAEYGQRHQQALPSHGYARTQLWHLDSLTENETAVSIVLSPTQLGLYGYSTLVTARLIITLSDSCKINLVTENNNQHSIDIGGALHTYFAISDIANVNVTGLENPYVDKTRDDQVMSSPLPYAITEELDRVHLKESVSQVHRVTVVDNGLEYKIENQGNNATVVWNPWIDKAKSLIDMHDHEYKKMLCIESAIVEPIELLARQSHSLKQTIS